MNHPTEPAPHNNSKLFFTIHLGSPNDTKRLDEHDRVSVIHKITQKFDTFTLTNGKVFWDGRFEDALLIHIATNDTRALAELAQSLRYALDQDVVAIQFGTHMLPCHRDSDTQKIETIIRDLIE